ncbi:hypothetical protein McPS_01980 [Marichromatium sp. PS1]|uniref:type II secretion system protein n=1 Tax=Marichromatium sp. PS1 TaxID=3138932 RepID=UPI0032E791E6
MNTKQRGFTLVEMSVALLVGGLTFMAMPPLLEALGELNRAERPGGDLERVREALIGHLVSHDRLPCPATSAASGEAAAACGGEVASGFVPYRTLGLTEPPRNPQGFALRYAVAGLLTEPTEHFHPQLPAAAGWTAPGPWNPSTNESGITQPSGSAPPTYSPPTPGVNGLDLCVALVEGARETPAEMLAVRALDRPDTRVRMAVVLVDPGADGVVDSDNRATPFASPGRRERDAPPVYDDRVEALGFTTLAALLDCPRLIARVNASARDAYAADDLARAQQWFEDFRRLGYEIRHDNLDHAETAQEHAIGSAVFDVVGNLIGTGDALATATGAAAKGGAIALSAYAMGMAAYSITTGAQDIEEKKEEKATALEQARNARDNLLEVIDDRNTRVNNTMTLERRGWYQ